MLRTIQDILNQSGRRFLEVVETHAPAALAAMLILVLAWAFALLLRWAIVRASRAIALDRVLEEAGFWSAMGRRSVPAGMLLGRIMFWFILIGGVLLALSLFNTQWTSGLVASGYWLFPRLLFAAGIILIGMWLGRIAGQATLVWAYNEHLPRPRYWGAAVRITVFLMALVITSDLLNLAHSLFLGAFLILFGGMVITGVWSLGMLARHHLLVSRQKEEESETESTWSHL